MGDPALTESYFPLWKLFLALSLPSLVSLFHVFRKRKSRPLVRNALERAKERFGQKKLTNVQVMEGQLGGLAHADMLVSSEGLVLKPVQPGTRGVREVAFYEYASTQKPPFSQFLCGYHGVAEYEGRLYLALDDCRSDFKRPCTVDVKIGTKTYEDDAPRQKKERERKRYPPQAVLGCRVVGVRVWTGESGRYETYDKHFGYGVRTENDLLHALRTTFLRLNDDDHHQVSDGSYAAHDHSMSRRRPSKKASHKFLERLEALLRAFEGDTPFHFISSSLFFVYDAESDGVDLRLIDFAHVRYDSTKDRKCIVGLRTLINVFRRITQNDDEGRLPR